ncbi:MAG: Hpt domain-containing protein [Deltaproteobacteria bacterium]|nr:Hpt domain-containing protein [Deltaproteobacteria bacterium]
MLIDREKAFRELDMPEELFDELLDMFIEQTEPAMKMLEEITSGTDYEEIRKSAHLINGSAGNLRIEGIQTIAKQIELGASQKQDIEVLKSNIEKLRVAFEEVKKEIARG